MTICVADYTSASSVLGGHTRVSDTHGFIGLVDSEISRNHEEQWH